MEKPLGRTMHRLESNIKTSNPYTGLEWAWEFQEVESPRFAYSRHMRVVRLSALRTEDDIKVYAKNTLVDCEGGLNWADWG
jgi:hypothetical protein